MNPLLLGPALVKRALDDLGAIAGAARRVGDLPDALLGRLDRIGGQLGALRAEMGPLEELTAVRAQLRALHGAIEPLEAKLDALRDEMQPIQHMGAVRAGIDPLDDDLRQVRESIDRIEPLVRAVRSAMDGIDGRLAGMSDDLAPLGDLAEKVPGVRRRD